MWDLISKMHFIKETHYSPFVSMFTGQPAIKRESVEPFPFIKVHPPYFYTLKCYICSLWSTWHDGEAGIFRSQKKTPPLKSCGVWTKEQQKKTTNWTKEQKQKLVSLLVSRASWHSKMCPKGLKVAFTFFCRRRVQQNVLSQSGSVILNKSSRTQCWKYSKCCASKATKMFTTPKYWRSNNNN